MSINIESHEQLTLPDQWVLENLRVFTFRGETTGKQNIRSLVHMSHNPRIHDSASRLVNSMLGHVGL